MRFQKILARAAVAGLLMGASGGAAMAAGCGDGVLANERFDGNLVVRDEQSCVIISSDIAGNLRVLNTANVLLVNNNVGGKLVVNGFGQGQASVVANSVFGENLVVRKVTIANVVENETLRGDVTVTKNGKALVQKNIAAGDINCDNDETSAFFNAARGANNCSGQP